ncbi:MAG: GGDEF domain-containing protein, partial [Gammaproteobacteria bacterium]|nr:GGDEF domain-containing protein [Gammaproteobacteria bacterium]
LSYMNSLGLIDLTTSQKVIGVVLASLTCGGFYFLIATDLNLKFPEPSLTFPQVLAASTWSLLIAWNVEQEARMLPVVWLLLAFLFGVYTLRTRQYLLISGVTLLGYLALVYEIYQESNGGLAYEVELLHWLILATGLFWMSLVGGYVSMLRRRLAESKRELSEFAFLDPLTGVDNRRQVFRELERELSRIRRGNAKALCLAMVDLDHFKEINDKHGHLVGDGCLQRVAEKLSESLRLTDIVGRYGGEEFLAVMPDTGLAGAQIALERLRDGIANIDDLPQGAQVTVSIGVAEYREGDTIEGLLQRCDEALYQAKSDGRNCLRSAH